MQTIVNPSEKQKNADDQSLWELAGGMEGGRQKRMRLGTPMLLSELLSGSIKFSIEFFLFSMSRSFDILIPYYWVLCSLLIT